MTPRLPTRTPETRPDQQGEGHPSAVFLRGLSLGALIGAAIAGSAIWDRRRRRAARGNPGPDRKTDTRS